MKSIVLYEIRVAYLLRLRYKEKKLLRVVLINGSTKRSCADVIKIKLLRKFSIASISSKQLFIRDYLSDRDTCIHFSIVEDASARSLSFAHAELKRLGLSEIFPKSYIENLTLIVARSLYNDILDGLRQVRLFHEVFNVHENELHISVDSRAYGAFMEESFPGVLVKCKIPPLSDILLTHLIVVMGTISLLTRIFPLFSVRQNSAAPTILTSHRDEYHFDTSIRNKIAWYLDLSKSGTVLHCLRNKKYRKKFTPVDRISNPDVIDTAKQLIGLSRFKLINLHVSKLLPIALRLAHLPSLSHEKLAAMSLLRSTLLFLWSVESNYKTIRRLNTKVYVYEDVYWEVHTFNTLAGLGFLKSIKLQYSNLAIRSLIMQSNPTTLLAFSEKFVSFLQAENYGVGPKETVFAGYPLPSARKPLEKRSQNLRFTLNQLGVRFVIGVFDESVQEDEDIWSWKTKSDHLGDIHLLCHYLLENSDIGIILKTQFMRNNPKLLYKNDPLIESALKTGRFLIPEFGQHRNLLLPSEIALASDICIGDLVGATASLEASLTGTRSILVDSMKIGREYRNTYYTNGLVVFENVSLALHEITMFRNGEVSSQKIGLWEPIFSALAFKGITFQEVLEGVIKSSLD
jgi:hypothetical protein